MDHTPETPRTQAPAPDAPVARRARREARPLFRLTRRPGVMPRERLHRMDAGIGPDPTQGIDSTLAWMQALPARAEVPASRPLRMDEQLPDTRLRILALLDRGRYQG